MQRTFCMIKPDAFENGQQDEILLYLTKKGFKVVESERLEKMPTEQADKLYEGLKDKPFFGELVEFATSGPALIMILERDDNTVEYLRTVMGATNSKDADTDTVRGQFGDKTHIMYNRIHGSDSPDSAKREISIFFPDFE